MTVVPAPPGLVHRHVVATAVRGLIDAVDGAPVPVPIAGLVARHEDAHAVAQVACRLDALDAAALADGETRMMAGPVPVPVPAAGRERCCFECGRPARLQAYSSGAAAGGVCPRGAGQPSGEQKQGR